MKLRILALLVFMIGLVACDKLDQIDIPNSFIDLKETVDPQVDSLLKEEMEQQDLVGMAVAIYDNDKLVHLKGYGYADWNSKVPWEVDTRGHWASISKALTAVAAFKLIGDGHMTLDETISDSLPNWPQTGRHANITIGQLLANRSGVTHYDGTHNWGAYTNLRNNFFDEEQAVLLVDTALLFNPGMQYDYSTFGWNLAGAYIAKKARGAYGSGDFVAYIEEELATPMNLASLSPTDNITQRSVAHRKDCNFEIIENDIPRVINILPGGGWSSTIGDLMLLGKALMEAEFLRQSTLDSMWMNQSGSSNYAYGWNVNTFGGERIVYHSGSKNGIKTMLAIYPDQDRTIAVMTNSINNGRHLFPIFSRIAHLRGYGDAINWTNRTYSPSQDIECDTTTECLGNSTTHLSGVWRSGNSDQLIRRGLSSDAFGEERLSLREVGYEVTDLETYLENGSPRYDGVFTRQTDEIHMWRGWQDDDFFDKFESEVQNGYRLFDIEVSVRNGTRYWSGLFEPGSGGYGLYRFVRDDAVLDSVSALGSRGFRLIDLEPYNDGSVLRWATVWTVDNEQHEVVKDEDLTGFNTAWNQLNGQGYRLIDLEKYIDGNGSTRYAGVFYTNTSAGALYRNNDVCVFLDRFETLQAAGRQLVDLEVHP